MFDLKSCINFANETKLCFLATAENDQPRVRVLGFWFADETGFYFQTGDIKAMYHQLRKNPKTEVCFYQPKPDDMIGPMLRIAGEVEFINDIKLKEKVLADRPFLKTFGLTIESPGLILFRIAHGQAYFWTMDTNLKPKEMIRF
jgi:pyridoxamine 5'-phosphate oxidase